MRSEKVQYTSDLDGTATGDERHVARIWDIEKNRLVETDLTEAQLVRFQNTWGRYMRKYAEAGRPSRVRRPTEPVIRARPHRRNDSSAIRAWALSQGLAVSDRGRIAREIVEQYEAAN